MVLPLWWAPPLLVFSRSFPFFCSLACSLVWQESAANRGQRRREPQVHNGNQHGAYGTQTHQRSQLCRCPVQNWNKKLCVCVCHLQNIHFYDRYLVPLGVCSRLKDHFQLENHIKMKLGTLLMKFQYILTEIDSVKYFLKHLKDYHIILGCLCRTVFTERVNTPFRGDLTLRRDTFSSLTCELLWFK